MSAKQPQSRGSYKAGEAVEKGNAKEGKSTGREPRQEIARQPDNSDSAYTSRRHKSIPRRTWSGLTGSQRTDSRHEMYYVLHAGEGMSHE